MKHRILVFILIFVLTASLIACSSNGVMPKPGSDPVDSKPAETKPISISFEQNLANLDKNLDIWTNTNKFEWSPDGSYAIFDAMSSKPDVSSNAEVILADVKNNKLTKLAVGILWPYVGWSKDSKYAAFNSNDQLFLLNTEDNSIEKISDKGYMPQFSPDNSKFIYMNDGLWIYDLASKSSKQITKGKYDTSPIWFSDSKRVFYFRDNGKNLGDGAGNQQVMSVSDTSAENKFSDVKVDMKGKFRSARWLEQDHKLFIYAGWDDGHSYNVLSLDDNELVTNIGPQDMYVYFSFDDANKRFIMPNGYTASQATVYDYNLKKLGTYDIYNDKEYPSANDNIGITALKGNRMIYLHTNQQENKGALMISYMSDGKQTRITEYGNYSVPSVSPNGSLVAYFENGSTLKIISIDNIKETEITPVQ